MTATATDRTVPAGSQQARILIVDDEDTNLLVLRRMLERAGYPNLLTVNDSKVAIERFCTFEPDLILLDLHMPAPDGFEIMTQLAPLIPEGSYVPVLVLTADVTDTTRERALAMGARDFLTKPFRYNELLLRLNNLLETRALNTRLLRERTVLEERVHEHEADQRAHQERRRATGRRIQAVLDADQTDAIAEAGHRLSMVFQPIVDLRTGEVVGAEALARFGTEPQRSPAQWFIEAAEIGLGIHLELAAIRKGAESLPLLPPGTFLSLNASAQTIASPALRETLRSLPADRLVIELTEHEPGVDPRSLLEPVSELRALGARFAIDDAGAGATSLQQILELAPEVIKLDRTFLDGLADDPVRRSLTAALVTFAADTGGTLVAEGLATAADLEAVRSIGIPHGQGLFLGEPMTLPFHPDRLGHIGGTERR